MKKLLGFILSILALSSCTFAINMPTMDSNMTWQTWTAFFSSWVCRDWWKEYYRTRHNYVGDSFTLMDSYQNNNSYYYIFDTSSKVTVTDPYNVLNFNGGWNFKWKSTWKPADEYQVIFARKTWSIKTWNILNGWYNGWIAAQVAFNLKRWAFYRNYPWGTNYTLKWTLSDGSQHQDHWHLTQSTLKVSADILRPSQLMHVTS